MEEEELKLVKALTEEQDPDSPRVLSCGGVDLRSDEYPLEIRQWKQVVNFPQFSAIRVYRFDATGLRSSIARILKKDGLN